jgi:hypothetical protein
MFLPRLDALDEGRSREPQHDPKERNHEEKDSDMLPDFTQH